MKIISAAIFLTLAVCVAFADVEPIGDSQIPLRGAHLTGTYAMDAKRRAAFIGAMRAGNYNAVSVAIKDVDGWPYVSDLPGVVKDFHAANMYLMARIGVFKDNGLAKARPDLAVHTGAGGVWRSRDGIAWMDPYNKEVWNYNVNLAIKAAQAGFDEIQFDYIRFPSDGDIADAHFLMPTSEDSEVGALADFLDYARERLKPFNVKMSICVFGLTASSDHMRVGQNVRILKDHVDRIFFMMYPALYAPNTYGLPNPEAEPYAVVERGVADAIARLGGTGKVAVFIQNYSKNIFYTDGMVRAERAAVERAGIQAVESWNPGNQYSLKAHKAGPYEKKSAPPTPPPHSTSPVG